MWTVEVIGMLWQFGGVGCGVGWVAVLRSGGLPPVAPLRQGTVASPDTPSKWVDLLGLVRQGSCEFN
jgi:hypothetical protein